MSGATDECRPSLDAASPAVSVTGAFGTKDLTVHFPVPLLSAGLQRTILTRGAGPSTARDQRVVVVMSIYNGRTGKLVRVASRTVKVGNSADPADLNAGYQCVPLGSRVLTMFPSSDLYGSAGSPQLGVEAHDSLVVITDVVDLKKPPIPVAWPDAPAVHFDSDGVPHVRLIGSPPSGLRLKVLRSGSGAAVAVGDDVTVTYEGLSWLTHQVFDDSQTISPTTVSTQDVVPGFAAALVGQRVGSTVIITVPAKYALERYQDGGKDLRGQSVVFVINLLGRATR